MGRPVELHPGIFPDLLATAVMHMTLAIAYAFALAPCIYRFSLAPALAVGALAGLGLYALNFLVFQFFIVPTAFSEISTAVVHVIYALFFTSVYKAFSVPKVANSIRE